MYQQALNIRVHSGLARFIPPPPLTLSQWSDEKAVLSPESSAEAGKWATYSSQREIMDAMTDPAVEYVTLIKSARVGYTKMLNWDTAYHIEHDPCSQLIVQPTIDDAQGYSKDEIGPMLRDVPCLQGLVSEAKSRDSNNTILKKNYPGGTLTLIGANSARGFRRITVRRVKFDEVDGYPPTAGHEGDQIQLGIKRTETFWNRKIIIGSTPTIKGRSRVENWFNLSDQRHLFVPCPYCRTFQRLRFANMKWPEGNPERAYFVCEHCKKEIDHRDKRRVIDGGQWRAEKPFAGHAGFHLWAAYSFSPGAAWGKIAKRHADATHHFKQTGDFEQLKTVINTDLGETWEEKGDGIESLEIRTTAGMETDKAPDDVLAITAGVDVQKDRLELEIVGWGQGEESWSLDYVILHGDTERQDVWDQLDDQLNRTFERGLATLRINAVGIDSGNQTQTVYKYVKKRLLRRVFALKGSSLPGQPVVGRPTKKSIDQTPVFPVGTDTVKDMIFYRLKIDDPGAPGYCHFPDGRPQEYFDQLTAEQVFTTWKKGVQMREYRKVRRRNEALDCRVYAIAALYILRPVWLKIAKKIQEKTEEIIRNQEIKPETYLQKLNKHRNPGRRKGGFVHDWKR